MKKRSSVIQKITQENKGRFHFTFKGVRYGGCLFLLLVLSCHPKKIATRKMGADLRKIDSIKILANSGDLIFRNGLDDISRATRKFNRQDTSFSHCGIVVIENKIPFVYHAIGGSYNPSQFLKKELLDSFCTSDEYDRIAVYRYPLSKAQHEKLQNVIQKQYTNKIPFDLFFNFESDDRMYCSEFVFKSMNAGMNGALNKYIHHNSTPVYISIDDLFLNKEARLIKKIEFEK